MRELRKSEVMFSNADLRRLIVPLVIEQLLAIAVGLCDSIMVSQVGEAAISAVSLVDTVNILLINAFSALATGGAVIVGQYLGRREMQKAGHSGAQLLLFMSEISLLVMALTYLAKGFVLDESVQRAKDYISGALAAMLDLGKGSGPMNHAFNLQGEYAKECAGR